MNSKHACSSSSWARTQRTAVDRDETDESCDAMAAGRRLDVTHGLVVGGGLGGSGRGEEGGSGGGGHKRS